MKKFLLPLSLVSLVCCSGLVCAASSDASVPNYPVSFSEFKLKPNVSVKGLTGNATLIKGEALFPFYGDQSRVLFGLVEGDALLSNNAWYAGAGLGYRQIVNNLIYGGYVIADNITSATSNHFWLANPGFEMMGEKWDFNVNAYLPLNSNKKTYTQYGWADEFGCSDAIRHTGHNQYNHRAERTDFEAIGRGADFRIGRTIPGLEKVKGYIGAYYFDTRDAGQVRGGLAKLSFRLNKYAALELTDSYDNKNRNRLVGGLRLMLGGYSEQEKESFGISSRLMDHIERGYVDTVAPVIQQHGKVKVAQQEELQYDNIWFFKPATQPDSIEADNLQADGTFEHPFFGLNSAHYQVVWNNRNIGRITAAPILYLEKGTYSLADFKGFDDKDFYFQLPANWGISGWDYGFKHHALGSDRPVILGGIDLWYDTSNPSAHNILQGITIHTPPVTGRTNPTLTLGIVRMNNADNVLLDHVTLGADSLEGGGGRVGIWMENSALNLVDTDVYATDKGSVQNAPLVNVIGIYAKNSALNFMSGRNIVNAEKYNSDDGFGVSFDTNGILAANSHIVFSNGENKISATNFGEVGDGSQIFARAVETSSSSIEINGGRNFFAGKNALSDNYALVVGAYGFYANTNTAVNINGGKNFFSADNLLTARNNLTAVVRDIYSDSSVININGGVNNFSAKNTVTANDDAQISAVALFGLYSSIINLKSGYNIVNMKNDLHLHDRAQVFNGMIFAYDHSLVNFLGSKNNAYLQNFITANNDSSFRIDALSVEMYSGLNFFAGSNFITAKNQVTVDNYNDIASDGILAVNHSVANLNGGYNIFNLTNSVTAHDDVVARAIGIDAEVNTIININGGINSFNLNSDFVGHRLNAGGTFGALASLASTITVTGGTNIFNLVSRGTIEELGMLSAMGFGAQNTGSIIDLRGGTNSINMGIFGESMLKSVFGIYADSGTTLKVDGNPVTNLNDVLKKFSILDYDKNGSYTSKYKIFWNGVGFIEWL